MTLSFPTSYFRALSQRAYLTGRTITGGQSSAGVQQVAKTDGGGFWIMEFTGANLRDSGKLKAWRALEALLDGGVTQIVVPLCDIRQAPVQIISGQPYYGADEPHSDDTLFSDGTGYSEPVITAETVGTAALRAVNLSIKITLGGVLVAGCHFSLDHGDAGRRMYRVASVNTDDSAGTYGVTIRPPLREATVNGMAVDFEEPSCVMRLINPDNMPPAVEHHRFATGAVAFQEAF